MKNPPILDFARTFAAGKAKLVSEAKHKVLVDQVALQVAKGYRVEELLLVERAHPSLNPELDRVEVCLSPIGELVFPVTLAVRRWFRRNVAAYEYAVSADRKASKVQDGQSL